VRIWFRIDSVSGDGLRDAHSVRGGGTGGSANINGRACIIANASAASGDANRFADTYPVPARSAVHDRN
jgi:hypothetical protein